MRRRAEAHNTPRRQEAPIGDADALRLLHELQVHQIELELQNDASSKQSVDFGELINERHFGKHILVVDDQPMLLEVTTKLLEQVGLRVSTAVNGEEAIRMARETEFALIMMDVQMPKIDGFEATRQIRRMPGGEKLPIIGVSRSAFIEDERRSLAAGMSAYVAKPYKGSSQKTEFKVR